jgi:hypothetical protein
MINMESHQIECLAGVDYFFRELCQQTGALLKDFLS